MNRLKIRIGTPALAAILLVLSLPHAVDAQISEKSLEEFNIERQQFDAVDAAFGRSLEKMARHRIEGHSLALKAMKEEDEISDRRDKYISRIFFMHSLFRIPGHFEESLDEAHSSAWEEYRECLFWLLHRKENEFKESRIRLSEAVRNLSGLLEKYDRIERTYASELAILKSEYPE